MYMFIMVSTNYEVHHFVGAYRKSGWQYTSYFSAHVCITRMSAILSQGFQVCKNITISYSVITYELSIYELSRVSQKYWTVV